LGQPTLAQRGAQVVITVQVADPALAVAPLCHHHGWSLNDWNRLADGTLAGHPIKRGLELLLREISS